jgi:hypothetical protein
MGPDMSSSADGRRAEVKVASGVASGLGLREGQERRFRLQRELPSPYQYFCGYNVREFTF